VTGDVLISSREIFSEVQKKKKKRVRAGEEVDAGKCRPD
jgi:hypothetical protein